MSTKHSTIRATDLVALVVKMLETTNEIGATHDSEAVRRFCDAEAVTLRNVLATMADHARQVERNAGRAEAAAYKAAEGHAELLDDSVSGLPLLTGERRARMTELLTAAEESAARHGEHAAQAQSIAWQANDALRRILQRV